MNTYVCRYCRQPSDPSQQTCPLCGAPVDIKESVSDSGWVEQPPIRDMAKLQFGQSHCQIEGTRVPTADFNLAQVEKIYFSHHVMLWSDPAVRLENMSLRGGWKRAMAGLPLIMVEAHGPGHIGLSDNHAGEVIALPMQHGQSMWVKEHRFLCATGNIHYDWGSTDVWYVTGEDQDHEEWHYPMGQYGDIFSATDRAGLLLLHAQGNVFIRDLRQGESLLVQPGSLVYRDMSVRVHLHMEYPRSRGFLFWRNSWEYRNVFVRLVGPGRVAVQSIFERPEDMEQMRRHSYATRHHWLWARSRAVCAPDGKRRHRIGRANRSHLPGGRPPVPPDVRASARTARSASACSVPGRGLAGECLGWHADGDRWRGQSKLRPFLPMSLILYPQGTPEVWTGSRNTGASATHGGRPSLSRRPLWTGRTRAVPMPGFSSYRSITRDGCTGTSGWSATGC